MGYKERKEKAVADKTAAVIKADFITFDEAGDEIIGKLLAKGVITPANGGAPYGKYRFETDDGNVECAPGGVFDGGPGSEMSIGKIYSLTFKGKVKNVGGHFMNTFEVLEIPE